MTPADEVNPKSWTLLEVHIMNGGAFFVYLHRHGSVASEIAVRAKLLPHGNFFRDFFVCALSGE